MLSGIKPNTNKLKTAPKSPHNLDKIIAVNFSQCRKHYVSAESTTDLIFEAQCSNRVSMVK